MNKILEALEEDRFTMSCSHLDLGAGPWTIQEVALVLGTTHRIGWCAREHTVELIEVTN